VIAVTDPLRQQLVGQLGLPPGKLLTIENGVVTERFSPGKAVQIRESLGIPQGICVLGTVARLDPVKNIGCVLRALQKLPEVHYLIVGEGPEYRKLLALASGLGICARVHFLGARDDIPEVMRALDLFVLASRSEGCSNTLLEAMATELPIIATGVGGTLTLIDENKTGVLIPPDEPEAIVRSVEGYLADRSTYLEMGRVARETVIRNHSLRRMIQRYEALYMETIRNPN